MSTTITFSTDEELKNQASKLFDSLGMDLTVALNLFMKQAVLKQKYPCSLEIELVENAKPTYPDSFFDLFGSGKGLGFDEEPEDLLIEKENIAL